MDGAFAQLSMLGSSVVLIAGFLLLWRRGLSCDDGIGWPFIDQND